MKKIIGIAFIIVLIFVFSGCSSVITYNSGRYESKNVGEIQYATIDNDFSTAIDTKEKAYKESDVLGLFLNVGVQNVNTEIYGTLDGVNTIVLINDKTGIETKEDIDTYNLVQKELEIIAKDITAMSYKFRVVVNNNYPYIPSYDGGRYLNFKKELKKGIFPIRIQKLNQWINTGFYDRVTLSYDRFQYNDEKTKILNNQTKSIIRHEIYHCLGLGHYTYSFDESGSKNGRMINTLPKFARMNTMAYSDGMYTDDRMFYLSNPDDLKVIELFSTVPSLERKIISNTCITKEELTEDNNEYSNIRNILQSRILDKYNVFIGKKDEKNDFDFGSKKDFYDIETIKDNAIIGGGNVTPTLTFTTLMLSKVGCNVIDKMFAEKKPLSEIIDYAEKYYNTEIIPAIDIYLEAKLVSFYKTNIKTVKSYIASTYGTDHEEFVLTEISSNNKVLTRAEFDARLKKKYKRELTTSKEIFSSLRAILNAKGVM